MEKKGYNQFVWGAADQLKTIQRGILLKIDPQDLGPAEGNSEGG
jgi:hypothetical protein